MVLIPCETFVTIFIRAFIRAMYLYTALWAQLLTFSQKSLGNLFVPLFNLSLDDDLRMQITTTAAETFTFTPVIVSSIVGQPQPGAVQTLAAPTSVSKAILSVSDVQA